MKKILALTSCVVLLSSGIASAAALATGAVSAEAVSLYGGISAADAASGNATLIGKLSKGVKIAPQYTSTGYAVNTKHSSGNTYYGTAHDATAIYKKEVGTTDLVAPTDASYTSYNDWTAM